MQSRISRSEGARLCLNNLLVTFYRHCTFYFESDHVSLVHFPMTNNNYCFIQYFAGISTDTLFCASRFIDWVAVSVEKWSLEDFETLVSQSLQSPLEAAESMTLIGPFFWSRHKKTKTKENKPSLKEWYWRIGHIWWRDILLHHIVLSMESWPSCLPEMNCFYFFAVHSLPAETFLCSSLELLEGRR